MKKLFLMLLTFAITTQSTLFGMDQKEQPKLPNNIGIIASLLGISPMQLVKQCYRKYCLQRNEPAYLAGTYLLYDYFMKNPTVITATLEDVAYGEHMFQNRIIKKAKARSPWLKYAAATVVGLKLAYELFGADQITEINETTKRTEVKVDAVKKISEEVKNVQTNHGEDLKAILKNQDKHTHQLNTIENQQKIDAQTLNILTVKFSGFKADLKNQTSKIEDVQNRMATKEQVEEVRTQTKAQKDEQTNGFARIENLLTQRFDTNDTSSQKILTEVQENQKILNQHSEAFAKQEQVAERLLISLYVLENFVMSKESKEQVNLYMSALQKRKQTPRENLLNGEKK